jgi:DNA-directed RNA polymerase specialized sigma subunit
MHILKLLIDRKYRFFAKKIVSVTKQIWDYEFKVEKTLQVREGVRQDRDKLIDARHKMEAQLKAKPDDVELQKELAATVDTINRYEAQMNMLDSEIFGVAANGDDPGKEGVNDIIGSLAELRKMYKEYLRKI